MTFAGIQALLRQGECDPLEFKQRTEPLSRAADILRALLNRREGVVLVGVLPAGKIVGQLVADGTLHDVAQFLRRFDPPAPFQFHRVRMPPSGAIFRRSFLNAS